LLHGTDGVFASRSSRIVSASRLTDWPSLHDQSRRFASTLTDCVTSPSVRRFFTIDRLSSPIDRTCFQLHGIDWRKLRSRIVSPRRSRIPVSGFTFDTLYRFTIDRTSFFASRLTDLFRFTIGRTSFRHD
jgi:hypothetical protein